MDALLKAMEQRGCLVDVTKSRPKIAYYGSSSVTPWATRVMVGEDWVHFALTEKRSTIMETRRTTWGHTWKRRAYVFIGALSLSLTNVYWIDVRNSFDTIPPEHLLVFHRGKIAEGRPPAVGVAVPPSYPPAMPLS